MTDHWHKVVLDRACSLVTDGTHHSPVNGPDGDYMYVTAKNIRRHGLDLTNITYVDAVTHDEIYRRCPVQQGDVLYIKDGVTTGLAAVNHLAEPFSLLSSVALLKPRREVLAPTYLKHWLNSPSTVTTMVGSMTGSAIKRLVLKQIRSAEIPLPPLPEQRRIADKLDAILARVDACRDRLDRVGPLLQRFRRAAVDAACDGRLTEAWRSRSGEPQAWQGAKLGDLIAELRNGLAAKPDESATGSRILRISAVRPLQLNTEDYRRLTTSASEASVYAIRKGDVLFTRYNGSIDLVGVCAVADRDLNGYVYPDKLIRVRAKIAVVLPEFLALACSTSSARRNIKACVKSSAGQKGISGADLKALDILVPTLAEQVEVVAQAARLMTLASNLEQRLRLAQRALAASCPALLAKAFRGELVPQDPNDEPAAEMLARLGTSAAARKTNRRKTSAA